jgi:tRNA (mo5U34)-methyltransferase
MTSTRESKRGKDFSQELAAQGWYHSFELPDGTRFEGHNTLDILRQRYGRFPLPAALTGKRVLDIGAWDGWFSFEAERRGAAVTAIDCVEIPNFRLIHEKLHSKVDYRIVDFFELPEAGLGQFDYVFFLGVLYHLKHPLLALEMVCAMTTDTAIVESFVTDAQTWRESRDKIPSMEFYETDELGNQLDNWIGPGVTCLMALCRAAGFARVELMYAAGFTAGVACFRKWEPEPAEPAGPPPELTGVMNNRQFGINFSSRKEEYIACWFRAPREAVSREELCLEVGGFGVPGLCVYPQGDGIWQANFRLPPGVTPGMHPVRLRFADSRFGSSWRIAVDMKVEVERLAVLSVLDGCSRKPGEVEIGERGGTVTCWVEGLAENSDRANTAVWLGGQRLRPDYMGDAVPAPSGGRARQVNAVIPADTPRGEYALHVECAGVRSGISAVRLV